jgi:FkbM family methyltransferase
MHIDYLQVGAHTGATFNDNVFNNITEELNVILIEPIPDLFSKLVQNYKEKSTKNNIEFLNIAISTYDGTLDLYSYKPPPPKKYIWSLTPTGKCIPPQWVDQLASVNKNHIAAHGIDCSTIKTTVLCKTLNSIIRERNIVSIENLHTDTEGHDYDILMSLDFELVKPTTIVFEHLHIDHEPNAHVKKYATLLNKFESNGYKVTEVNKFDTHITLS